MKNCLIIIALFILTNSLISDSAHAGQARFDRGQNPFVKSHLASRALPFLERADLLAQADDFNQIPTQLIINHAFGTNSQPSLVLLKSQTNSFNSPSWIYLGMIIVLGLVLLWDKEPIKTVKRKIRYL